MSWVLFKGKKFNMPPHAQLVSALMNTNQILQIVESKHIY